MKECKLLTKKSRRQCTVGAILYAMQFSIFARSLGLIAAEHPVKVAGITEAAAPGYAVKDPAKVFGGHFCCGGEIFQGDAAGVILSDAL